MDWRRLIAALEDMCAVCKVKQYREWMEKRRRELVLQRMVKLAIGWKKVNRQLVIFKRKWGHVNWI